MMYQRLLDSRSKVWLPLFLAATTYLVCAPLLRGRLPGGLGDARFNNAVLEMGYQWLAGRQPAFFSPQSQFFPHANTLAYSDSLLTAAPPYWLLRAAGFVPVKAFAGWVTFWVMANFLAMFALARKLQLSALAASCAALLFAAGLPRIAQLNHIQLFVHAFTPLAYLSAVAAYQSLQQGALNRTARQASAFVSFVSLQLMSSYYLGWFLLLAVSVLLTYFILKAPREFVRDFQRFFSGVQPGRHAALFATVTCLWLAVLGVFFSYYLDATHEVGGRSYSEVLVGVPRIGSWLAVSEHHLFYRPLLEVPVGWRIEHRLFVGWVAMAAVFWGLWKAVARREHSVWATCALMVAFVTLVSTSYGGEASPWYVVYRFFPGGSAIRAVARIILLELPFVALCLGFAIDALRTRMAVLVVVAMFVVEQWAGNAQAMYQYTSAGHEARIVRLSAKLPEGCDVFWVPSERIDNYATPLDAVWVSLTRGIPTINGYSGNEPTGWFDVVGPGSDLQSIPPLERMNQWFALHPAVGAPGRPCVIGTR